MDIHKGFAGARRRERDGRIRSIMRSPVTTVSPGTSVRAAAALMRELDIGVLPVCENGRVVGLVTDRDIVVRWAPNAVGDISVSPLMTRGVETCRPDEPVAAAAHRMADLQIRRIVVVDEAGAPLGIVTLGDIANDASEEIAGQTLGEIVEVR